MATREASCSFCLKDYREVGPLVEGPDGVYICGDCSDLCQSIIGQERRRRWGAAEAVLPSAAALRGRLDDCIHGQEAAKETLVAAVLAHYSTTDKATSRPLLLVGPSSSSRLALVRSVAHILEVPFAELETDQPGTMAGIDPWCVQLLTASDFDIEAAGRTLVYVEAAQQPGVQAALLDRWDNPVPRPEDPMRSTFYVDVSKLLFICGADYPRLADALSRLGRHPEQPIPADALIALGAAPPFARRFETIVSVPPLDEVSLSKVVRAADWVRLSPAT